MTFEIPEHIREALKQNKKRYISAGMLPQVEKKHCKWCLVALTGRRTAWCGDDCIKKMLAILGTADKYLLERCGGKCEICSEAIDMSRQLNHTYECDHLIPLSEGGGTCPTNLRILCRPCHKKETKALAGRLAAKRRQ